ncbi:unnamed protein product, partial [Urochloa humidicola]
DEKDVNWDAASEKDVNWDAASVCMLELPTPDGSHMVCLLQETANPNLLELVTSSWSSTVASSQ